MAFFRNGHAWPALTIFLVLCYVEIVQSTRIEPVFIETGPAMAVSGATLGLIGIVLWGEYLIVKIRKESADIRRWAMWVMPLGTSIFGFTGSLLTGFVWILVVANVTGFFAFCWASGAWGILLKAVRKG
ncbi:MAG: hypothetical protein FJ319_04440 [SAR202 cluster bacterium]|nr:hypothetical protein [SAR202 cluster bacterium]